MNEDFNDRRKCPRIPLDVEVNCSEWAIARSKDISRGGICLIMDHALVVGRMYTLEFYLPLTDEKVKTIGRIMWCRHVSEHYYESGIQFWKIDKTDRESIDFYFSEAG